MIQLFHGTNTEIEKIDLSKCRPNKDFGKGFYLTNIRSQAEDMAKRRAYIDGGVPIVLTYKFDETSLQTSDLKVKIFETVSEEWALFIIGNRKNKSKVPYHNYDIVIGPIADDGVVRQIDRYLSRMIDLKTLVDELRYKRLNNQYFFGSELALSYLTRI